MRLPVVLLVVALVLAACSVDELSFSPPSDLRAFPEVPLDIPPTATPVPTSTPAPEAASEVTSRDLPAFQDPCGEPVDPDSVGVFPGDWAVGEGRNLEIIKLQSQLPAITSITPATVEVVEVRDDGGYLMRWTSGPTEFDGASPAEQQAVGLLGGLFTGVSIDYTISAQGWFLRVENPDEVVESVREAYDFLAAAPSEDFTAADRAQIGQFADALLANPEFVSSIAVDPQTWHGLYGESLEIGTSSESEGVMANALGAGSFRATTVLSAPDRDANGCSRLSLETRPDPDAFFDSMVESLEQLGAAIGEELSDEDLAMFEDFTLLTTLDLVFDEGTGWPREATASEMVSAGPESQSESTTIVDLGPLDR